MLLEDQYMLEKRRASGRPQKPSADQKFPVRLEAKDSMRDGTMVSKLPDADMQAAPKAMLRAAQRAREIAWQTNTPLVLVRDGVLVEEYVTERPADKGQKVGELP